MESFKDAAGRLWTISVDPVSIDLVKAKHGVDLLESGATQGGNLEDPVEIRLAGDPLLLCRVLYDLLVDPEPEVPFEGFAREIRGAHLLEARNALWEDMVNFTPDPQEARVRKAMQEKVKATRDQGMERIYQLIESPELEQRLAGELRRLDATFTNLLDELASIQADSPQENSP